MLNLQCQFWYLPQKASLARAVLKLAQIIRLSYRLSIRILFVVLLETFTSIYTQVRYRPIDKPYDRLFDPESPHNKFSIEQVDGDMQEITLSKSVFPSTKYEILVLAQTSAGKGDSAVIEMFTSPFTGTQFYIEITNLSLILLLKYFDTRLMLITVLIGPKLVLPQVLNKSCNIK